MHVGAKKVAMAGLLVAFAVVLIVLSSVIETNSLFLIAAASFCVGIAVREWGLWFGFAFLVAAVALNLVLAPNKFFCVTFAGMGLYIWLSEMLWEKIATKAKLSYRTVWLWIGKYVIFNAMYIPVLFFIPQLIFTGKMNGLAAFAWLLMGQILFFIYDVAYRYFQAQIWGRLRKRFIEG